MSEILKRMSSAVIQGQRDDTRQMARDAIEGGCSAEEVLYQGLMPGMDHVSGEFKAGRMFVPEVMRSARAMLNAMEVIKPIMVKNGIRMAGKVVLGTVQGDLHDIGKNLVGMMCEGAGFEIHDLGADVAPGQFVEAVKAFQPDIVGMSALLTTTMRAMEGTVQALVEAGVRDRVKVMIGGAPVTQAFADRIGVDGYAPDAAAAADKAKHLIAASR
ncbi:MAG: corrinoid protein [Desulfobacterales bacterium]|nr:corrinoid protein [Desulfobacterales bacterium]